MEPSRAMAEQLVGSVWREGHRPALIDAPPMRPGRGRETSHPKGRRLDSRRAQDRSERLILSVAAGLESGSLCPEAARRAIHEAGLDSFVRVVETREEALDAFADFYGQGFHLMDVNESEGLLHVRFSTRKQLT